MAKAELLCLAIERLGEFLISEAVLLHEVKDDLVLLQNKLEKMQPFLKDVAEQQNHYGRMDWLEDEIALLVRDTQDIMDTFILTTRRTETSQMKWPSTNLRKYLRPRISSKIIKRLTEDISWLTKDISCLTEDISRRTEDLRYISPRTERTNILHFKEEAISDTDDDHVVGFEDDADKLKDMLFLKHPLLSVIVIYGMGGLGKTTLARKLYKSNDIQCMFDCQAWVSVSQEWRTRDLIEGIIKSFRRLTKDQLESLGKMQDYDMEEYMRIFLNKHRFLVVIDDMWQKEAWESLRRALPDNKNGSRIIITTRKEDVAELSDWQTYVHKLRFLRPKESWELFCMKAFPIVKGIGYHCPPKIEYSGKDLVRKCDGLPLTIILLGKIFAGKEFHEWEELRRHIWVKIKNNSIDMSLLLDLSYRDLSNPLKLCFLYLGLFPDEFVINAEKLIRLWVAEGFIPQGRKLLQEEVADTYLKDLVDRRLILVVQRNWRGMIATCRVHGLLRDLTTNEAKNLKFFKTLNLAPLPSNTRVDAGSQRYTLLDHSYPKFRTLLFCNSYDFGATDWLTSIQKKFILLRVLDLEGAKFDTHGKLMLPDAVGELIHLRYLGLKDTNIVALPDCIGNLQDLQTLEASLHSEIKLPREVCKLKKLRHLRGHFSAPTFLYEELTDLLSLKFVEIGGWIRKEEGKFALNSIAKLRNLRSFSVLSRTFMLSITPLLDCRHLMELRVHGRIGKLPEDMHECLSNLMYLELKDSGFEQDPMPSLAMFEDLIVLELQDIGVKHITCTETGFFQLEVFKLICKLEKLQMHEEAMPRLKAISIFTDVDDKSYAQILPKRLASLPAVAELNWESESLC